jgi:hypothetical protein
VLLDHEVKLVEVLIVGQMASQHGPQSTVRPAPTIRRSAHGGVCVELWPLGLLLSSLRISRSRSTVGRELPLRSAASSGLLLSTPRNPEAQRGCGHSLHMGRRAVHGEPLACSGVTGTPSLQRPMKRCLAVPPSATWQSCRRVAQSCNASSSFQGP